MIQSFKDADTKELFEAGFSRRWAAIRAVAHRKLDQIEAAYDLFSHQRDGVLKVAITP